jgi:hypothetical protein
MHLVTLDFMSISSIPLDDLTKARIVYMILNKRTEEALEHLSNLYNTVTPEIVVGTVKGKRKTVYAVYVQKESKIYAITRISFTIPLLYYMSFIII